MLSAETRAVALLGHPVAHSLSPRMQNAAFAARGLNWAYVAFEVPPARLAEAVRGLAALGFAGANVTAPHKTAVVALCDEVDPAAERAGSANTLVFRDGRVVGMTTDAEALGSRRPAVAAVVGGGGAARAFAARLEESGSQVRTFSRRGSWPPDTAGAELVVHATPVVDEALFDPQAGQVVVDLAYRRDTSETALAAAARARGCELVDGLEVLVRQGAASFERWTGVPAPVELMAAVVRARAASGPRR